jgi:hypothetical protein
MAEKFQLRRIDPAAIPKTLDKAERYRLLNDPEQARSICQDVLAVEPENQRAIAALILSLTDLFSRECGIHGAHEADELVQRLTDPYERAYYSGIIRERTAHAYLARPGSRNFAYETFREAMEWYDKAEQMRPPGNEDALLRWNACARTIDREGLEPRDASQEPHLE